MVTADLLSRARAGDGQAFRELAESHRRELQVHCYRMLGSLQDAEDAVQETLLAARQGIGGFTEERASLRTWLCKIAAKCRLRATRPSGCSRFLTPSSRVPSACRPGRRPATSRAKPSRWPS